MNFHERRRNCRWWSPGQTKLILGTAIKKKSLRLLIVASALCMMPTFLLFSQDPQDPVQVFMPDGQLRSHPIRVFINREITPDMNPRLLLTASHAVSKKGLGEGDEREPEVVAPNQRWVQAVEGNNIEFTGTLFIFDLRNYPIPYYKATIRLTPILKWKEYDIEHTAVGGHEVYLADATRAFGMTLSLVIVLVALILFLSRRVMEKALYLFSSPDGTLSLWRSQIAAWTLAIGGMVTAFGLIQLEVPKIPESLVALMGLSLATGGITYMKVKGSDWTATKLRNGATQGTPKLGDLLCDWDEKKNKTLSIAKAQMIFWTILMLTLFVTKSALDGVLWNVPWEMVALMGMSQAGYVSPKLMRDKSGNTTPGKVGGAEGG